MKKFLIGLSFSAALFSPAYAEDKLLWQGTEVTGRVTNGEECHATIRLIDGKRYYNPVECHTPHIRNYLSLSWPLDEPPINMRGIRETRPENARVLPNGKIKLQ